jgi:tetratricopeptide (TPR) repeat protein
MRKTFLAVAVLLAAFAAEAAGASAPAAKAATAATAVRDPWYGEGLFYFFQDRHFTALTHLLASEQFGRVTHHGDDVELLRAGLLLSYGMHREAGAAFERLIERGATPAVRDRAWYFLARIRFQRGYTDLAEQAISRVQGNLAPELEPDRRLLQANLLMARGEYGKAAQVLRDVPGDSGPALYARFNLGVALVRDGQALKGSELLERVGRAEGASDEVRALRDKANVALGFAALREKLPERAMLYLERVRLQGMLANRALLGFGWSELALERPQRALVAWNELVSRDASDAAVLEAHLAIPYATAQMGGNGQALEGYERALTLFEAERSRIDAAISTVRSGEVLRGLLARNPREEAGWRGGIEDISGLPGAGYLVEVLASHAFQEAFKNYRDLHTIAANLAQWDERLPDYDDMLATRARAYSERIAGAAGLERSESLARLAAGRDALGRDLAQAERDGDGLALADARASALAARLAQAEHALRSLGEDPAAEALRERARRVRGALLWEASQQYTTRHRDAEKDLRALDATLVAARASEAGIARAKQGEPERIAAFAGRSRELAARLRALQQKVGEVTAAQEQELQEIAVSVLEQEKEWLAGYATQARFAMAQIYDRAGAPRDAPHPAHAPDPTSP